MKKFILHISAIILFLSPFSNMARAQASISAHAAAEVIEALTATETAALNFGRFSPETSGGEITLSPDGTRRSSGTVILNGGNYTPAVFYISGQKEATVTIALPTNSAFITNSTNGKTMEVTDWKSYPEAGTGNGLLKNGLLAVNVGATLKVKSTEDNPVGIYTGTYTVTFSYN